MLLNPNDLYITGVQTGVVDKNGRTKNILQALCLSKDLECYKGITQTQVNNRDEKIGEQDRNESTADNLPARQSGLSKLFSKLRARFMRKQPENSLQEDKREEDSSMKAPDGMDTKKKSWDLSPEQKEEIQKGQVDIAKKHRELQEHSNEDLEQVNQQQIEDEEMQF